MPVTFINTLVNSLSLIGRFWQEKINGQLIRWNIFLIGLQLLLLIFRFNDLPRVVPLFYSLPWGYRQLVSASTLFVIPISSILILVINSLLAVFLLRLSDFFSRLLLAFSLVFSLLGLVCLWQIIRIIT